jgi:hypothetical protein
MPHGRILLAIAAVTRYALTLVRPLRRTNSESGGAHIVLETARLSTLSTLDRVCQSDRWPSSSPLQIQLQTHHG